MSSSAYKQNPFQKSNPFQVHPSYQPSHNLPLKSYQQFNTYRTYQPAMQSYTSKQNSYIKTTKYQNQQWKFRQDNCSKTKISSQNQILTISQKYIRDKNSFQKQLVMSNAGRRSQNHVPSQIMQMRNQKMQNPFNRKYLVTAAGGKLVQSQVYVAAQKWSHQAESTPYDRKKTQYPPMNNSNYINANTYLQNNYTTLQGNGREQLFNNAPTAQINQTKGGYEYQSRKSVGRQDSFSRDNIYKMYPKIESTYSLGRDNNHQEKIGSSQKIYPPSTKNIAFGTSRVSNVSRGSNAQPYDGQDRMYAKERVNFQSSDSQNQHAERDSPFGVKMEKSRAMNIMHEMEGPDYIVINGNKFYKQKILSF